jgi:glycosyltransferase involved in cell wall biosynthesis
VGSNRVLHLIDRSFPHTLSGFAIRSMYIVRSQRQIGLDAIAATRLGVPRLGGVRDFPLVETVEGVEHHRLVVDGITNYNALRKDRYMTLYAEQAARLVEKLRPSVIHAAGSHLTGIVALALKQRYGIPLVYEVRNFYEDLWASHRGGGDETEFYAGRARAETQCMLGADRVVTLGEGMKERIVARGVPADDVIVIGNAVDVERFAPRPRNDSLIDRLGLAGRIIVGYVSGLRPYEGVDILLGAIRMLIDRGHKVGGLVVGGGVELESLQRLVIELGLSDDVRLTGEVPHAEVLDYYPAIDIFVVPRRSDPVGHLVTPLKPFEAMAMGLPLIVADVGALHEVAQPEERGLGFTPDDPGSLADAIERLVKDPALGRATAQRARDWVLAERTWVRNAERYRDIYRALSPGFDAPAGT